MKALLSNIGIIIVCILGAAAIGATILLALGALKYVAGQVF